MRRRTRRIVLALVAAAALLLAARLPARAEDDTTARKGRPRPQVTFKGSSPYFKVDFDRYTGKVTCVWCHPKATAIWEKEETFHRDAFAKLDEKARANPACVKCHVTAYNRDGEYPMEWDEAKRNTRKMGYTWGGDAEVNALFTGVQCEACHGPNCGNRYDRADLEAACRKCHNEEYPGFTGFDPKTAFARMKHAAVGADEHVTFDAYAGVDACFMCHRPNYETWQKDQAAHAKAYEVLDEAGRKDPACLKCHTTGFHREGSYPLEEPEDRTSRRGGYEPGGAAEANAKFLGVQCEACHGINCGTYVTKERIAKQCVKCHSGECEHDAGFSFERDYPKVEHRPPADYVDTGERKVLIEWYDLGEGLETAANFRMPLLVLFSNPPDG